MIYICILTWRVIKYIRSLIKWRKPASLIHQTGPVQLLMSADYVGRPYCFCSVSYYYYFFFFHFSLQQLFSSGFSVISQSISLVLAYRQFMMRTPVCGIFKSIGLWVRTGRGPKVLLGFTMYNRKNSIYCAQRSEFHLAKKILTKNNSRYLMKKLS